MSPRQGATARIDVPGKPEVDEPDRPTLPSTDCGAERLRGDERVSDRGRGEDDIGLGENLPKIRQRDGLPAEGFCQLAGPREIPIQDADLGARPETLRRDSCHLPCPNQCDDSILDRNDGLEESNGGATRARVGDRYAREAPDPGSAPGGGKE